MPATLLLHEDFEGYAPGYVGLPTNFNSLGVTFFEEVLDFTHGGNGGEGNFSGSYLGKTDHGYYFGGDGIQHTDTASNQSTVFFQFSIFGGFQPTFGSGGLIAFASADITNQNNRQQIFRVAFNADGTLGIFYAGGNFVVSPGIVTNFSIWDWMQVNATIGANGSNQITADVQIYLHGLQIINTGTISTNINAATAPAGAKVNQWIFYPGGNIDFGSYLDNIYIYGGGLITGGTFPAAGTPNVRLSEGVVEYIELPTAANIRETQGVIEYLKLPSSANIRASQMVIELIRGKNPSGAGARVYEA